MTAPASAPAPVEVLTALAREGLTFSDCVAVFAQQDRDDNTDAYVSAARRRHVSEGSAEVDNPAVVSVGEDGGAYVMALGVGRVSNEDAGIATELCERCRTDPITDEDSGLCDACTEHNNSRVVL